MNVVNGGGGGGWMIEWGAWESDYWAGGGGVEVGEVGRV